MYINFLLGHSSSNKRHPLGMRVESLTRKIRINKHDTAVSKERPMCHCIVRYIETLQHDSPRNVMSASHAAGHQQTPHAPSQESRMRRWYQTPVVRQTTLAATIRSSSCSVHKYHAFKIDSYIT